MNLFKRILTATILILFTAPIFAQFYGGMGGGGSQRGYATGKVMLLGDKEGEEAQPGEGAVVVISYEKRKNVRDSLYSVVGFDGSFFIRNIPMGPAHLRITLMGYEEISSDVSINPGENKMMVNLRPESLKLSQATVTAKVAPLAIVKDTVLMNAAAVKVNKGEYAIDILQQMPGVEVTENGVTVLNEEIKNVYVDGTLLFGNSPMDALNNLAAEEVVNIKSYQEYENKDPRHKISETEEKQRVLEISTRTKPKMVVNGNLLAGMGYDTDTTYHKFRYTLGGNVSATSEKLQIFARVNTNNINNDANRNRGMSFGRARGGGAADLKSTNLSLNVTRKWMHKSVKNFVLGQVNGGYSYSSSYNVNESRSEKIYFPTAEYTNRKATSTSLTQTQNGRHNFSLGGMKSLPDGQIRLNASYSLSEGNTTSYRSNYNFQDLLPKQGTSNSTKTNTESDSYSVSLRADKGFANTVRVGVNASLNQDGSEAGSVKIDTLTTTINHKVLNIDNGSASKTVSVAPYLRFELGSRQALTLNYNLRKTHSSTDQMAFDMSDINNPQQDMVNTKVLTNDNTRQTMSLGYNNALWKDGPILRANISYNITELGRDETMPVTDSYNRTFHAFTPSISLGTESMMNRWNVSYNVSSSTPSLEQVRPRLDNTNLYNVTVGNVNLKEAKTHRLFAMYSTPLGKNKDESVANQKVTTLFCNVSFSLTQDRIVSNDIYYADETYLPEYGYTMPKQSTLSSYVNAPNGYSAGGMLMIGTEIKPLRSNFNGGVTVNWDNTPGYVNNNLFRVQNLTPSVILGLRSNFSQNLRFNLDTRTTYMYNDRSGDINDYFTESINAGVEVNNILKRGYIGGNYTKTFMQFVHGEPYSNVNDNILDIRTGLRFGPRNNIDISVNVHDLFNRTSGFSISRGMDFVTNSWVHNFGRYVMFNLAYQFNSMSKRGGGNSGPGGRPGMGGPGMGPGGFGGPGRMGPPMGGRW